MELFFCEKCGKRISDVEIERGEGVLVGGLAWCNACRADAPEAAPQLPPKPGSRGAAAARRAGAVRGTTPVPRAARHRAPPPRAAPPERSSLVPVIAIAAGVLAGLVAGLVVFWSGGEPAPPPKTTSPRTSSPAPRPEPRPAPQAAPVRAPAPRPVAVPRPAPAAEPATAPVARTPENAPPPAPRAPGRDALMVSISKPVSGALVKPGSDVTLAAFAMGGDGTVARIEFLRDGEKIGEATGGDRSFTWRSVREGTYRITARATDGSGETAESAPVQINVAPTKAVPGYFVEAESGRTNMQTQSTDQASGGSVVKGNSTGNEVTVDIAVAASVPGASVAVRNVGWGSQNGSLRIQFGPSGGDLQEVGGRIDCRGGWKWKRAAVGRDIAPGTYRVKLRVPNERGGGAFDVIGIVPGNATLPNRLVDGRLEEGGWTVEVGRSASVASRPAGGAGAGAAGGGAAAAPAAPRVSDERAAFASLARRYDGAKVTRKKLAAVGGAVAGSSSFDSLLKRELDRADGYAFAGKMGLAGSGRTAASIRKALEGSGIAKRQLDYEKPEVVRVCFDLKEALRLRDAAQLEADLTFIGEEALARGAVPVFITLLAGPQKVAEAEQRVRSYNDAVVRVAGSLRVPFVDAWGVLNSDPANAASCFTASGQPKPAAHDAVNAKFLELYRRLEEKVLARGKSPAAEEAAGGPRSAPDPGGAPAASDGRAAANLIGNGGFEELGPGGFATGWQKWSERRGTQDVRIDRADPHAGDRAARVWAESAETRPGVLAKVTVGAGRYEIRFWACADAGKAAQVQAHLAGVDTSVGVAPDDWKQFRHVVVIPRKVTNASLRLWTASGNVRVRFDDVGLVKLD